MTDQFFTVGVITGTHGIRGEVKVLPKTDFPEARFVKNSKLSLRKPGLPPERQVTIQSARPHKNVWLVQLEGFADINLVEAWRGMELVVPEQELMKLPKGTYYIHQLVGMDVYLDDGRFAGKLVEVLLPGANDVYVVRGPLQKPDLLLPAIPSVVQEVDIDAKRMTVHLLPGLLAEDAE